MKNETITAAVEEHYAAVARGEASCVRSAGRNSQRRSAIARKNWPLPATRTSDWVAAIHSRLPNSRRA